MENTNTGYHAPSVEPKWYAAWEDAGLFKPESNSPKPRYTITIPPPNITGSLHMGHALCYPLQDMLGRYKRLTGYNVLILPGQDHAGIATQSVVIRNLKAQNINAAALGREKFVEKVWEWRHQSGDTIIKQFRELGLAFDWSHLRFTLDEDYVEAVYKVFIDWFDRGLIYKGLRVVNWDPVLQTSISDIETDREVIKGKLYHIRYDFADGDGSIIIATTRPETMLADVAVAVHPSDKRYHGLVGKDLILPLMNRRIPLIADEYPDPEFGTGAVKITPAHDPNDYEVGQRHNLDMPIMLNPDGKVSAIGGPYAGLDRKEARKRVVEDLEASGHLVKVEDHEIPILISERSKEVIEPLASEQWFVKQKGLAQPAIDAVEEGRIEFHPARYKEVFLDWMGNIRDWNISRQLWWGHQIPVYYTEGGTAVAARNWEEAERKSGKKIVKQDQDVLDTWFSSGLWPFATLGWPQTSHELKERYPTDVLVTSREILYLWVARMAMMGLDFIGDVPFRHVYIYATVLTKEGKRMSKSLGTGVDPVTMIEQNGADALRWALLCQTGLNQDIRYNDDRVKDGRNLCNKVWNATRFVLGNLSEEPAPPKDLELVDKWLLSRLVKCEQSVRRAYDEYDVQVATTALYEFFWTELCDWAIEISKSRLADPAKRATPQWVLLRSLEAFLIMLHPIMPFVTEEVYALLPLKSKKPFLMQAEWPSLPAEWADEAAEAKFNRCIEITRGLRAHRAECGVGPGKQVPVVYYEGDLQGMEDVVAHQAWVQQLIPGKPLDLTLSVTVQGVDLHLPAEGLIDPAKEVERLGRDQARVEAELAKLSGQLDNPEFMGKAKPEVVERLQTNKEDLVSKLAKINDRIKLFGGA